MAAAERSGKPSIWRAVIHFRRPLYTGKNSSKFPRGALFIYTPTAVRRTRGPAFQRAAEERVVRENGNKAAEWLVYVYGDGRGQRGIYDNTAWPRASRIRGGSATRSTVWFYYSQYASIFRNIYTRARMYARRTHITLCGRDPRALFSPIFIITYRCNNKTYITRVSCFMAREVFSGLFGRFVQILRWFFWFFFFLCWKKNISSVRVFKRRYWIRLSSSTRWNIFNTICSGT